MDKDKMRVIRIEKKAIEELLFEYFMDDKVVDSRLNIDKSEAGERHFVWDKNTGDLVCAITHNDVTVDVDFDKLLSGIPITTDSIFSEKIYLEVDLKDYLV